jgi:hypothetical protein
MNCFKFGHAVCASALLATSCFSAFATEWFVSPLGSDAAGNGSVAAPYKSLGFLLDPALGLVRSGDTVTLRGPVGNNVFNETEVRLRVPLKLRSFEGEWAVISCPITLQDGVCVQIDPSASGSSLSRLEVTGGNLYGVFMQTDWDSRDNRQGLGASNIVLEDCKIHDTGRDAIKITPKSDDVTIRRCEIYNTGRVYPEGTPLDDKNAEGIDNVNGSRMLVQDNYIHDIATTGLYFKGGAQDVTIERNRIERTGLGGIMVGFDTSPDFFDAALNPRYYESIRGTVINNVVRDTGYAGIGLYAAQDAVVANNTVVNTASAGHAAIYFGVTLQDFEPSAGRPANINPIIRNNLIIQNGGDCARIRWANEITAAGLYGLEGSAGMDSNWFYNALGACNFADNRPGSPLADGGTLDQWRAHNKVDARSLTGAINVTSDGHLLPGSPAIDKGETLTQVTQDIDRQPRLGAYDIGADEVTGDTSGVPVCTLSASPAFINVGAGSTLTAICNPIASSYTWTGGTCAGTTSSTCTVMPSSNTTYTVQGANSSGNSSVASATVDVSTAAAIGLYDGIYLWSDGNYLSLHQDASKMIATIYFNDNGVFGFKDASGGSLTIAQLDLFDLLAGSVTGSTAKINGTIFHRACNVSYDFVFGANATLTATRTSVSNTAIADAAGISCNEMVASENPTRTMQRIGFGAPASPPVTATGLYDGIYAWADGNYLSVHQDSMSIIATNYFNDSTSMAFRTASGSVLLVPQLDLFDLLSGPLTGSTAQIKGTRFHRACNVSYDFTFGENATLRATRTGVSNTAIADAAGISCSAILGSESTTRTMQKIFFGQ